MKNTKLIKIRKKLDILDANSSVLLFSIERSYNASAYLCEISDEKLLFLLNFTSYVRIDL